MVFREDLVKNESFIFRYQTFGEIYESLREVFGASAGTILYLAAVKSGRQAYVRRKDKVKSKAEALKLFARDKADQNWGDIDFRNLDLKCASGTITVKNCFESKAKTSNESGCFFFKGYLTGFLSELLQSDITLDEVKCVAKGDSHCEYILTRPK